MKKLDPSFSPKHDLDALLHPAQAFANPRDVVNDPDLTLNEKRAVLASWASDSCAVEAAPALRQAPGAQVAVTVDEILEALRTLDAAANATRVGAAAGSPRIDPGIRTAPHVRWRQLGPRASALEHVPFLRNRDVL